MTDLPLILIVEDEPSIRIYAHDILADHGYAVLACASADEGLSILQNQPEIRAVLTDVVVPGTLDGLGLISEIRRRWPGKEIIVTSGRMPAEALSISGRSVFLAKPYDEEQLLTALSAAHARPT